MRYTFTYTHPKCNNPSKYTGSRDWMHHRSGWLIGHFTVQSYFLPHGKDALCNLTYRERGVVAKTIDEAPDKQPLSRRDIQKINKAKLDRTIPFTRSEVTRLKAFLDKNKQDQSSINDKIAYDHQAIEGVSVKYGQVITQDGASLDTYEITPNDVDQSQESHLYIVQFNGNGTLIREAWKDYCNKAKECNATMVVFDYRGAGANPTNQKARRVKQLHYDGYAQVQRLLDNGINPQRIVLYGHSLGGWIATHVARTMGVNLFNDRSFAQLTVAATHLILPQNIATWLRVPIRGIIRGCLRLTGWEHDASIDYAAINPKKKAYLMVENDQVIKTAASLHHNLFIKSDTQSMKTGMVMMAKNYWIAHCCNFKYLSIHQACETQGMQHTLNTLESPPPQRPDIRFLEQVASQPAEATNTIVPDQAVLDDVSPKPSKTWKTIAIIAALMLLTGGILAAVTPTMPALFSGILGVIAWKGVAAGASALLVPGLYCLYRALSRKIRNGEQQFASLIPLLMAAGLCCLPALVIFMPCAMLAFPALFKLQGFGVLASWGIGAGISAALLTGYQAIGISLMATARAVHTNYQRTAAFLEILGKGLIAGSYAVLSAISASLLALGNQLMSYLTATAVSTPVAGPISLLPPIASVPVLSSASSIGANVGLSTLAATGGAFFTTKKESQQTDQDTQEGKEALRVSSKTQHTDNSVDHHTPDSTGTIAASI